MMNDNHRTREVLVEAFTRISFLPEVGARAAQTAVLAAIMAIDSEWAAGPVNPPGGTTPPVPEIFAKRAAFATRAEQFRNELQGFVAKHVGQEQPASVPPEVPSPPTTATDTPTK